VEEGSTVTMLRTLVTPYKSVDVQPGTFEHLIHEMKRSKWLDPLTHELVFEKFPEIGVTRGEIITGLCAAVHPLLSKTNPVAFSNTNIFNTISNPRFIGHAGAVADLFIDRFRPSNPLSDPEEFDRRCRAICASVDSDVEDSIACEILMKMINVVRHTLKTNLFMPDRYALSLRLDPACMAAPADNNRELSYGVLFVHGRRFNGFHVRFRDIARGGLRLVTPKSEEQLALESARQYDECYGLAFAQQLKNKDIPEGGSKAVCLIHTAGLSDTAKYFVMRKSVKAMTDAILDLIVTTDYTQQNMVDYWKKKEVLYLGPDEQVIPEDIEWIVKRAAARGCKCHNKSLFSRAGLVLTLSI
jgi:glutamate dehydrogenase